MNHLLSIRSLSHSPWRWILTAGLAIILLMTIHSDWEKLQPAWKTFHSSLNWQVDPKRVELRVRITNVNHFRPDLSRILVGSAELNPDDLAAAANYYERIIEYFPQQADAYGLLAFCQYHLGHPEQALQFYEKAATLNPHFFWYPYHAGLIYRQLGRPLEAARSFERALAVPPQENLKILLSSRIYQELLREKPLDQTFPAKIKGDYQNAVHIHSDCVNRSISPLSGENRIFHSTNDMNISIF